MEIRILSYSTGLLWRTSYPSISQCDKGFYYLEKVGSFSQDILGSESHHCAVIGVWGRPKSRATFFIRGGLNVRLTILSPDPWRNMTGGPIQEREKNTGID